MQVVSQSQRDHQWAFLIFRLSLGVNIFLHGATRIVNGPGGFADAMSKGFTETLLPHGLVWLFLAALPFVEGLVGLMLIFGLGTRLALIVGGLLMTMLIFGTALRSQWAGAGSQLVYALVYYLLLVHASNNFFSLDTWLCGKKNSHLTLNIEPGIDRAEPDGQ